MNTYKHLSAASTLLPPTGTFKMQKTSNITGRSIALTDTKRCQYSQTELSGNDNNSRIF